MATTSSSSKSSSLSDALRQLENLKSSHQVYNALVIIRTHHAKGSDAANRLRHYGGIEKLLKILSEVDNIKCQDVALSILGNCCLDDKVRLRVLKCGGVKILCDVLQGAQKESVRHRACRAISNLCENIACCDAIHDDHSDTVSFIVTSLLETEEKDCKVTYCRAIRLLADTDEHREFVLSCRAVKPIAAMLKSEDASVVQAALKTTAHFVNNCSEECTRQLAGEGVLSLLVALASSSLSSEIASTAASLLLSVATTVPLLRPYLSGAGAVQLFIRRVTRSLDSSETEPRRLYRAVDAICHCCRDANSRVKIREHGGLKLLIGLLTRDVFALIHDRIISSLVCFIYDDAGVETLLRHGLIGVLVHHLYRSASIDRHDDIVELRWLKSSRIRRDNASDEPEFSLYAASVNPTIDCQAEVMAETDKPMNAETNSGISPLVAGRQTAAVEFVDISSADDCRTKANDECAPSGTCDELQKLSKMKLNVEIATNVDGGNGDREKSPPNYSIHSPTYKAVSMWQMNADDCNTEDFAPRNIYEGALLFADASPVYGSRSASSSPSRSSTSGSPSGGSSPRYASDSCGNSPAHVDNGGSGSSIHASRSWSASTSGSSPARSLSWSSTSPTGSPARYVYSPFSTVSYLSPSQSSSTSYSDACIDFESDDPPSVDVDCDLFGRLPLGAVATQSVHSAESESGSTDVSKVDVNPRCCSIEDDDISPTTSNSSSLPRMSNSHTDISAKGINAASSIMSVEDEATQILTGNTGDGEISAEDQRRPTESQALNLLGCTPDSCGGSCSSKSRSACGKTRVTCDCSRNAADETSCDGRECCVSKTGDGSRGDDNDDFADEEDALSPVHFDDGEDVLDVEAYQRNRDDQRKFSRLLDMANTMYAAVETCRGKSSAPPAPLIRKHKRRRSSSSAAGVRTASDEAAASDADQRSVVELPVKTRRLEETKDRETDAAGQIDDVPEDSGQGLRSPSFGDCAGSGESASTAFKDIACGRGSKATGSKTAACRQTVKNVLNLVSRVSHLPDSSAHLIDVKLLYSLLDYVALADNPVQTACRVLLRLSRDHGCFEPAVLGMFPLLVDRRLDTSWRQNVGSSEAAASTTALSLLVDESVDRNASRFESPKASFRDSANAGELPEANCGHSRDTDEDKRKRSSADAKSALKEQSTAAEERTTTADATGQAASSPAKKPMDPSDLRNEILANLSVMASSGYGQGVLMHALLRGDDSQRQLCAISLCYLCRNASLQAKFLSNMKCIDVLMSLLENPDGKLFSSTVLALSHFVRRLSVSLLKEPEVVRCAASATTTNDLTFELDDGSSVEACRSVLVQNSDVFAAMLSGSFREADESTISIPGATVGAMELMIRLSHGRSFRSIATGRDTVLECFDLCHRFQMADSLYLTLYRLLIPAVTSGTEFSRAFNVLNKYGLGVLQRDFVLRLFVADTCLTHRCSAVTEVVRTHDCSDFLAMLGASLLELVG